MIVNYKTFKASEISLLERYPRRRTGIKSKPVKKRSSASVRFRHATAVAYSAWRAGLGSTSKCSLKVLVHGRNTFK
jgi:hypothetical protein